MIFGNLGSIISDHYSSLSQETGLKHPFDYVLLGVIFIGFPTAVGFALASYVTLWSGFITASASVLSVLTGFSINTIILLMRYDKNGSHPYEQQTVIKTKEFTLYAILSGVVLIICLVFGFVISQIGNAAGPELGFVTSGVVYSLMGHYFLTLLVITHRFWALIHGDVL